MINTTKPALHTPKYLKRKDDRIVIHFDYDCFYAAVFESENPALKSLPLAVQQKQIIVTCNYVARERGLRKLQLITDAKQKCPEAIIVLGEDLTRFRDASKALYSFIRAFSWNDKVERLGFDEVWMDVTDIVDYNLEVLNGNNLQNSFFQLSRTDPTSGFLFDASSIAGHTYPVETPVGPDRHDEGTLRLRLVLGSHLALHIRHQLEEQKGYTSTVGISTTKLISKLVGNVHKPKGQTTLIPPYAMRDDGTSSILSFLNDHDLGKIPGIGFKLAQKLREHILNRPAKFDAGLVYGPTREQVTVKQVREADLSPEVLEKILGGPGSPHGIGTKVCGLIHGIDDAEVTEARNVPRQISLEDSYIRLDTMEHVVKELKMLSSRLIDRMRIDLTESVHEVGTPAPEQDLHETPISARLKWVAIPSTLRLTTRPRLPLLQDGTRPRTFKRISRSAPLPSFLLVLSEPIEGLADRLVKETLIPLFKKLHPERSGWNLSLVNVAVTGMDDHGKRAKTGDIGTMFRPAESGADMDGDIDMVTDVDDEQDVVKSLTDGVITKPQQQDDDDIQWDNDSQEEDMSGDGYRCDKCGTKVPVFARVAHERFHEIGDQ